MYMYENIHCYVEKVKSVLLPKCHGLNHDKNPHHTVDQDCLLMILQNDNICKCLTTLVPLLKCLRRSCESLTTLVPLERDSLLLKCLRRSCKCLTTLTTLVTGDSLLLKCLRRRSKGMSGIPQFEKTSL